ncbi:hypothetical protein AVEN_170468-1 [Araneus ventricosus]|uniref:Uncharacterized protein n=1 Tax=Araneus ventricosus TaxID=182803 RepID=A0A4Y2C170_ARAVE|nr:hypothetical protein AVEN_170468-1 [Araneus ventricosus]
MRTLTRRGGCSERQLSRPNGLTEHRCRKCTASLFMNFPAFLYPSLNKRRSIGVSDATASPYRIPHLQPGLTDNPPQKSEYGLGPARPSSSSFSSPLLFSEPKPSLSPTTNKIPESAPNARKQSNLQFRRSEIEYFAGSERIEGDKVQYFCLKGLVKNPTAVVCKQHRPFSQGCESLTPTKGLLYAASNPSLSFQERDTVGGTGANNHPR